MLKDMVPHKSSMYQFIFTSSGVIIVSFSIFFLNNDIFKAGVSFLFVGSIFILKDLMYMINFKGD